MPSAKWQPAFSAGVLGPGLHGRMDLEKYDLALKVGENAFIHAHGGVSNRSGTEFIGEVMDHTKVHRLIPFVRGAGDNQVLVMGDSEMKVIDSGAFVQSGGGDYNPTTPFAAADVPDLDFVQSVDVMYFAHPGYFPRKMTRASATSLTFANLGLDPTHSAPTTSLTITPSNNDGEGHSYVVSTVIDGVESFASTEITIALGPDLSLDGRYNDLSWDAVAGADRYHVYRKRGGAFGYIGYTETADFRDDNISPDLTTAPYEAAGIFTGAGEYPSAVTLFQQRLILAATTDLPETVWASQVGAYENFSKSKILRDSDRIEFDITGGSLNRVKWLIQLRELLVFAETGEWSIVGPQGGFPATNIAQTQYGYSGAGDVKPIVAEDTALFVDRTKNGVRDLRYAFEQDGYTGNDLTIFAYHYFEGRTIEHWAYQKTPNYLVWCALDDGTLLSLTYKREHQVWAWSRHDVGGEVESLCVIEEGNEDSLYMIVKRTIGGSTKRYIERMHTRQFTDVKDAFFVDCGITYSGSATTTITGLTHLDGETVTALADGSVVTGLTVSSGQVTLPRAASKVHVGLPYESEIETLPPAIQLKDVGSSRGRPVKANRVWLQVEKTRGIQAGPASDKLNEYLQTGVDLAADIPMYTGTLQLRLYPDWSTDGTIVIKQTYPLPMTILGISPDYSIGRTPG